MWVLGSENSWNNWGTFLDGLFHLMAREGISLIYFNKQCNFIGTVKISIQVEIPMTPFSSPSVKRKQAEQNSARQKRGDSPANLIQTDLQRDNKSSLDVLSHMIQEVERELEEYERCTGREVPKKERSEGLSGFTLSLVNALCRLMRYLKEVRDSELLLETD